MVNVIATFSVTNAGSIVQDIIVGASIFADPISDDSWVADFPWIIYPDVTPGNSRTFDLELTNLDLSGDYTYWVRGRAWRNYDLIGATLINGGVGWQMYTGGHLFDQTPGDGISLDQIDESFTVTALVTIKITNLDITVS